MKNLLPLSLWTKGSTAQFVDHCANKPNITDLVLRVWESQDLSQLNKVIDKFCAENKGKELNLLAKYSFQIDPNLFKEIENALFKKVDDLMQQLKAALQKEAPFPEVDFLNLIFKHWNLGSVNHSLWLNISKILEQREKFALSIELDHENKQVEKVSKKLSLLTVWSGRLTESERLLGQYGIIEKCSPAYLENYSTRLKEQQLLELTEQLFQNAKIPVLYQQRLQIFQFLFSKHFFEKQLAESLSQTYASAFEKARRNLAALNIDWLKCKSIEEANKKKVQLHLWQCFLPPNALVNFVASFLEFQYPDQNWTLEQRINSLNQAEKQLPSMDQALATPKNDRQKLCAYQLGLQRKIAEAKFKAYMIDKRPANAFELWIEAISNHWEWAKEAFSLHQKVLLIELEQVKNEEVKYLILLYLKRQFESDKVVDALVQKLISELSEKFKVIGNTEKLEHSFDLIGLIYRALSLGYPVDQALPKLKQLNETIEERKRDSVQALSRNLGSVLGEAFTLQPGQDKKTQGDDAGGQFERLYEQFRDVMLQQDPFAKDTEESLSLILAKAQKLIAEARSIEQQKSITAFQNMMSGKDDKGKALLIDDIPSYTSLIGEIYLGQEALRATGKTASRRPIVPEQALYQRYADLLFHVVSYQILKENNPVLRNLGEPLIKLMDFGHPDPTMWPDSSLQEQLLETFPDPKFTSQLISNERFLICNVSEWLRFENQEALKVPFRRAMAIVCSSITNGIVLCRDKSKKLFEGLSKQILTKTNKPMVVEVLTQMRKASQQINAIDCMKNGGILPIKFDRSIEPRVRGFLAKMTETLHSFGNEVMVLHDKFTPSIYAIDKAEFQLGHLLNEKEAALKRYLHMNLEELTRSYLRESNKGSVHSKIINNCIRVQQGINFRRSDQRNLRFPLIANEPSPYHTVADIEDHMRRFEENFPIIDRISGSRQAINEDSLIFNPETHAIREGGFSEYKDLVQLYQDNALKLARQLRIIIMPGQGTGNYEGTSHTLCIPLYTGKGRTVKMSLLSALADYLYETKFVNDSNNHEEKVIEILNKKSKNVLKSGTHDAKLKITQLIYQELGALSGVDKLVPNPNNIVTTQAAFLAETESERGIVGSQGFPLRAEEIASQGSIPFFPVVLR